MGTRQSFASFLDNFYLPFFFNDLSLLTHGKPGCMWKKGILGN